MSKKHADYFEWLFDVAPDWYFDMQEEGAKRAESRNRDAWEEMVENERKN